MDTWKFSIHEISKSLIQKQCKSIDLVSHSFKRIHQHESSLSSFISLDEDEALQKASEADLRFENNEEAPLMGIPVSVKDNFCIKGKRTTAGSKILENFIAPYDSTVTKRLEIAGAIIVGKNTMDEFAMGSSGEYCAFKTTHNPWDPSRVPGGSSSGSAAAVAARLVFASVGTDTGGSVRQPASYCGIVGFKPTYGRVSRYGMISFASSLDQAGFFTKTVQDSALLYQITAGIDPLDSTTSDIEVENGLTNEKNSTHGMKIGIAPELFPEGMSNDVKNAVKEGIEVFRNLGAKVEEIKLPHIKYCIATYGIIAASQASSNLGRYDGIKYGFASAGKDLKEFYANTRAEGFGDEVKRRVILGAFALSKGYVDAYYNRAIRMQQEIRKDFEKAFENVDMIVCPTCPETAFKIGQRNLSPLSMYQSDLLTLPANLAGLPAMSLPCGLDNKGLPIGMQLIGKPFNECSLIQAGTAFEQATDFHTLVPGDF